MAVIPGGDAYAAAQNLIASTSPATRLAAVTPADGADLSGTPRALYIGVAGNVAIVGRDDPTNTGTVLAVTAGQVVPIQVRRVLATGTTATGIIALY